MNVPHNCCAPANPTPLKGAGPRFRLYRVRPRSDAPREATPAVFALQREAMTACALANCCPRCRPDLSECYEVLKEGG